MQTMEEIMAEVKRVQKEIGEHMWAVRQGRLSWWPKNENTRYTDMCPRPLSYKEHHDAYLQTNAERRRRHS